MNHVKVSRKSDDGYTTFYSREERLVAFLVALGLVGLALIAHQWFPHTVVGKIVGFIAAVGFLTSLVIAVLGRTSND